MKLALAPLLFHLPNLTSGFTTQSRRSSSFVPLKGYLDDLTNELYAPPEPEYNPEDDSREATKLDKSKQENYGVGDWSGYVDFGDEFDGGDGQMGVAGDGNKGLEKMGDGLSLVDTSANHNIDSSRQRSAKVAWGTSSGYADNLRSQGVETSRAQQLENWQNQRQLHGRQKEVEIMEAMDSVSSHDEDWRMLAKFGVERLQDFNYDEEFGSVQVGGDLEGTIELSSGVGRAQPHTLSLANPYMGYADFRAAFTAETSKDWSVEPSEGSLSKTPLDIIVKYRPSDPMAFSEGYLVIETEDFKKTWKVIGKTA